MFHIVIPARMGSSRLPGKALADLRGKPMVYWVWQRALASSAASVTVATDHEEIASTLSDFGADVVMTRSDHPSGTDRLAEVVTIRNWSDNTVVVNLQGDEPMMPVSNLEQVARELSDNPSASIATLSEPITDSDELNDPAVVKVVASDSGEALYFSRAPIPFGRDPQTANAVELGCAHRHIGLYAYRCGFLRQFVEWSPSALERVEALEQLRALARGHSIRVCAAEQPVPGGVDTPDDLVRVRALMGAA